jgi:outer membrane autotransporter protein
MLGVRTSGKAGRFEFMGSLAWRHAFDDIDPSAQLAFASTPAADFVVAGAPLDRDTYALNVSVGARLNRDAMVTLGYDGEYGESSRHEQLSARLNIRF